MTIRPGIFLIMSNNESVFENETFKVWKFEDSYPSDPPLDRPNSTGITRRAMT